MKLHGTAHKPRFELLFVTHIQLARVQYGLLQLVEAEKLQSHRWECFHGARWLPCVRLRCRCRDGLIGPLALVVAARSFFTKVH